MPAGIELKIGMGVQGTMVKKSRGAQGIMEKIPEASWVEI